MTDDSPNEYKGDWLRTQVNNASSLLVINLLVLTLLYNLDGIGSQTKLWVGVVVIVSSAAFVLAIFWLMNAYGSLVLEVEEGPPADDDDDGGEDRRRFKTVRNFVRCLFFKCPQPVPEDADGARRFRHLTTQRGICGQLFFRAGVLLLLVAIVLVVVMTTY